MSRQSRLVAALNHPMILMMPAAIQPTTFGDRSLPDVSPATVPSREVYRVLDAWRGLAALWVVMFHASQGVINHDPTQARNPFYAFGMQGGLGVHLFFVISGYCIANAACSNVRRRRSLFSFVTARFLRIFPPMWASLPLFAAYLLFGHLLWQHHLWKADNGLPMDLTKMGYRFWLANFTLTQPMFRQQYLSAVCWTLCYEVAFYAIVSVVILFLIKVRRERAVLNVLHSLTAGIFAILIISPKWIGYPLDLWPEFGLGVLAYDAIVNSKSKVARLWSVGIISEAIAFIAIRQCELGPFLQPSRTTFSICIAFVAVLIALHRNDSKLNRNRLIKVLSWIGSFSYSLYLIHVIPLLLTAHAFKFLYSASNGRLHLRLPVSMVAAVIAAWGFHCIAERPFQRSTSPTKSVVQSPNKMVPAQTVPG